MQAIPQSIPAGTLTIVPLIGTVTVSVCCLRAKVAVQVLGLSMITDPDESQSPLHSTKSDESEAVAVSVTSLFCTKSALHDVPQSIPIGLLVTIPTPPPNLLTSRLNFTGVAVGVSVGVGVSVTVGVIVGVSVGSGVGVGVSVGVAVGVRVGVGVNVGVGVV